MSCAANIISYSWFKVWVRVAIRGKGMISGRVGVGAGARDSDDVREASFGARFAFEGHRHSISIGVALAS